MGKALTVKTKFTAIDKFSRVINKMTRGVKTFTKKASAGFAKVERFGRRMRKGFSKAIGKLGQLGLALGVASLMHVLIQANIDMDASLASLQAITGVTGEAFKSFAKEIDGVSERQKAFGADVAKAFEIVGSAQPILLKNAEALGQVTEASIVLSKAGLIPIEKAAKAVTGTMNQFGLDATHSTRVINLLAAGAKEGSANIGLLSESMDKVGAIAHSSNLTLEQTGAALELMSAFELKGAEAGISLKTTLLRLKSAQLGFKSGQFNLNDALADYNKKITKIKDPIKKAAFEELVFGKVHILTGKILTENVKELNRLTREMSNTAEAEKQAAINANTLKNRLSELKDVFLNQITSTDASNESMQQVKDMMVLVAENMDKVIKGVLIFTGVLAGLKAIMLAYNAVVAISNISTKVFTAAQWALNAAMTANPIGLIIAGIAALIGIIASVIAKYEKFGAALSWVTNVPGLGFVRLIQSIRMNWESLIESFKSGEILEGFKKIGAVLLDTVLFPIQQLIGLIARIPVIGKLLDPVYFKLKDIRGNLGLNTPEDEKKEVVNPEASAAGGRENTNNEKVEIALTANQGTNAEVLNNTGAKIRLTDTLGFQ